MYPVCKVIGSNGVALHISHPFSGDIPNFMHVSLHENLLPTACTLIKRAETGWGGKKYINQLNCRTNHSIP